MRNRVQEGRWGAARLPYWTVYRDGQAWGSFPTKNTAEAERERLDRWDLEHPNVQPDRRER